MEMACHRHAQAILTPEKSCGTYRTVGWANSRAGPDKYEEDIFYFLNWSYKILQIWYARLQAS